MYKNVGNFTHRQMMMNAHLTVQMVGIKISTNVRNAMFRTVNIVTMMANVLNVLKARSVISPVIHFQALLSMIMKLKVNVLKNASIITNMRLISLI